MISRSFLRFLSFIYEIINKKWRIFCMNVL